MKVNAKMVYDTPEIHELPAKIEASICGSQDQNSRIEKWETETFEW